LNFKKAVLYITILFLSACMIRVADLRLVGENPFLVEAIEGGCRVHFSVVNLGQKIARNAYIYFETWEQISKQKIAEYKLFLGDIKPGETRVYQADLMGLKWELDIEFEEIFEWD